MVITRAFVMLYAALHKNRLNTKKVSDSNGNIFTDLDSTAPKGLFMNNNAA